MNAGERVIQRKSENLNGEIIIGSYSHISSCYIMEWIEKVKKAHPDLSIKIVNKVDRKELIDLVENYKVDFAIDCLYNDYNVNKNLERKKIKDIDNIFISNKPICVKNLDELKNLNFILSLNNANSHRQLIKFFKEQYNINLKVVLELHTTELKIDAAKRGIGIAHVLKDMVKKELENKELYEVKIPIKLPKAKLELIYLKEQLTKANKKFIKDYIYNGNLIYKNL